MGMSDANQARVTFKVYRGTCRKAPWTWNLMSDEKDAKFGTGMETIRLKMKNSFESIDIKIDSLTRDLDYIKERLDKHHTHINMLEWISFLEDDATAMTDHLKDLPAKTEYFTKNKDLEVRSCRSNI
ncbi:hypothetical protein NDU88_003468 [Pleurodeles waltl]|uniref:Uncharacterized protein n=1 Tax=Pleurodeles waltl TaxID=8319 RepID=A0AAV7UZ02_PLEWA|nr:hypothetical protein NDU88_003468 [Pleurodeles waltl]